MIERRTITDREEWLRWRQADVTASVVPALFGVHPYETALKLFSKKCGLNLPVEETRQMWRGQRLEPIVGESAREAHPEWRVEAATEYFRNPIIRLGCTPDFFVHGDPRGLGVMQAKSVNPYTYKKKWDGQPPFWISLQTVTEMMLTGATWGTVAVIINDDDLPAHFYEVPRHAGVEHRIEEAVADFWDAVAHGVPPDPDYGRDANLLAALYPAETPRKSVNLVGDNALPVLLAERATHKAAIKQWEDRCSEIETEIKFKMGDAELASLPGWHITWKTHHRKEYIVPARDIRTLRIIDHRATDEETP